MNVEMDIRNQIFRYICGELKKPAEFFAEKTICAACDRITEEDSTWNFACLDFEAEASSDVCFVVKCLQPRLSNSCITPLFISYGTYGDQRSFCIFLPNLVEEKQHRRRKQSVSDMGTTYIKLSLSLSPQSQH
jgi:hypothetical protein